MTRDLQATIENITPTTRFASTSGHISLHPVCYTRLQDGGSAPTQCKFPVALGSVETTPPERGAKRFGRSTFGEPDD